MSTLTSAPGTSADIIFVCLGVVLLTVCIISARPTVPRPPGPQGLPIIGNIFDIPSSRGWLTFSEWGKKYGPIIQLTLLGQPLLVLNSVQDARALFDKRSAIYSDRPTLQMGGELVGWKYGAAMCRYGARFREYRRFIGRYISGHRQVRENAWPVQDSETRRFLLHLLHDPERFSEHVRRTAGAIILKLSYGYDTKEGHDPLVELVDVAMEQFSLASAPGAFLVDVFPLLRFVPSWFPGAKFQRTALEWKDTLQCMVNLPYEFAKQCMNAGTGQSNFTSELLASEKLDDSGEKEDIIKWSAASLYSGGADTTVSAINSFFLAMTLFSDVQKRAQEELDSVVGPHRLPSCEDRESLPYIDALVKEVLRWNPVAPLGVPHVPMEDDVYQGYHITKGTTIIANIWHMLHDPAVYVNPEKFDPARFTPCDGKEAEPDPREICFGFGRRICPGVHLADSSLFLSCAMVLSVFDISQALDKGGHKIEPVVEYTSGTVSHPKPFRCSIQPRCANAEALIRELE